MQRQQLSIYKSSCFIAICNTLFFFYITTFTIHLHVRPYGQDELMSYGVLLYRLATLNSSSSFGLAIRIHQELDSKCIYFIYLFIIIPFKAKAKGLMYHAKSQHLLPFASYLCGRWNGKGESNRSVSVQCSHKFQTS